jgi:hypothetical protein
MTRASHWTRLDAIRARTPGIGARSIEGIVMTYLGTGPDALNLISGIRYDACSGYDHPLDGQSIDFGEPGIDRSQVRSPWRELLDEAAACPPFTFELDHADQEVLLPPY